MIKHIFCEADMNKKFFDAFTECFSDNTVEEYVVYLSSVGGYAYTGNLLYNFISSVGARTTIYNVGRVGSAAVPFYMAFQNRYTVPYGEFWVHLTVTDRTALPQKCNAIDLRKELKDLEYLDEKYKKQLIEASRDSSNKITYDEITRLMINSTYITSQQAFDYGFVDAIYNITIPSNVIRIV